MFTFYLYISLVCVKKNKQKNMSHLHIHVPQNYDVLEKQRKIGLNVGDVYSVF